MREKRASIFIIIITLIISLIYFGYLLYGAKSENSYLESFNSDLQSKVSTLSDENNTLKAELDELKNGATNRIIEISQLYEEEKYNEVITKANELHEKFNGTAEDNEAQRLVMRSNDMINKINQATMEAEQLIVLSSVAVRISLDILTSATYTNCYHCRAVALTSC